MSERRKEIYVSGEVLHSLIMLARAQNGDDENPQRRVTADEIADKILRAHIKETYPQLTAHQKAVDLMEKETIASLSKKP